MRATSDDSGGEPLNLTGLSFGIVVSDYHRELSERLLAGAVRCFEEHGVGRERVAAFHVPGAFEIPQACHRLLTRGHRRFDGLVCLGVLIRGETSHFEVLAHAVASAVESTAREGRIPIAFGVLTVENEDQAWARAGEGSSNKGWEAAQAALRMAVLYRDLDGGGS